MLVVGPVRPGTVMFSPLVTFPAFHTATLPMLADFGLFTTYTSLCLI